MDSTKPWYASTGLLGSLLAGAAIIANYFGYTVDAAGLANDLVALIGAAMAFYGRLRAVKKIG